MQKYFLAVIVLVAAIGSADLSALSREFSIPHVLSQYDQSSGSLRHLTVQV
jgi:hypothetical protein